MEYLLLGEKITINRTDGRVHTAQVIHKHNELNAVMVSWREGFKMMGKQIPWDSVRALNPQLEESSHTVQTDEFKEEKQHDQSSEEEFYDVEPRFNEIGL